MQLVVRQIITSPEQGKQKRETNLKTLLTVAALALATPAAAETKICDGSLNDAITARFVFTDGSAIFETYEGGKLQYSETYRCSEDLVSYS